MAHCHVLRSIFSLINFPLALLYRICMVSPVLCLQPPRARTHLHLQHLDWAMTRRLVWVPKDMGKLTPKSHPTFLYSLPNLSWLLGVEWPPFCPEGPSVLVSRDDCAKTLVSSANPQEAYKQELKGGMKRAGSQRAVLGLACALSRPQ